MRENKTAWAILGLLSHEDLTGYDIKKSVESTLGFFWNAGFGQIYPTLAQLEGRGFVRSVRQSGVRGPERKLYSVTGAGLEALKTWLAEPAEKEEVRLEILLKLFFGKLSTPGRNAENIGDFRRRNTALLEVMRRYRGNLEGVLGESSDHLYYYMAVLLGEKTYAAFVEWADEALALLQDQEQKDLKQIKGEEEK